MKLTEPVSFNVSVRKAGSDNRALVRGEGIRASCTQASLRAAERAVDKLLTRRKWGAVVVTWKTVSSTIDEALYLVTISPAVEVVKYPVHKPSAARMEAI